MDWWFWNWGGESFGYRDGDSLFTYFGREVGRFDGESSWPLPVGGSSGVISGDCVQLVYKKTVLKGLKLGLSNAESTTDS